MADEPSNLVLAHLRHVRTVFGKRASEGANVRPRILGFETTMGHGMAQIGHLQIASQTGCLERMDGRLDQIEFGLDRIEKRLDLILA
jgi:hypothetical protein